MNNRQGSLLILAAIVLWSSLGIVIRLAGVPVHELIFYSALVSVITLSFVAPTRRYRRYFPKGRRLLYVMLLGPLLLSNTFTFFYAYKHTAITNAILTHHIAPVVVAVLALVFLKERFTRRVAVSIAVASLGLWLLMGLNPASKLSGWYVPGSDAMGIAAGLASGVANAVVIVFARSLAVKEHPVMICYIVNLVMAAILLPFIRHFPSDALWSFLVVGVVHSTLAPILYYRGMRCVEATKTAIIGYMEPVGAIIFGMVLFNEFPSPVALLGGVLILYSGYLAVFKDPIINFEELDCD